MLCFLRQQILNILTIFGEYFCLHFDAWTSGILLFHSDNCYILKTTIFSAFCHLREQVGAIAPILPWLAKNSQI
jgi:hypothetical protein